MKKSILPPRGCYLSRRESEVRREGKRTGGGVRKRVAGSRRAISMHLRFPRWCNKLLLIRPGFRSHSLPSRKSQSLPLPLGLRTLLTSRFLCNHPRLYFPPKLAAVSPERKLTRYALRLSRRLLPLAPEPPTSFCRPPTPKPRPISFFFLCSPTCAERC